MCYCDFDEVRLGERERRVGVLFMFIVSPLTLLSSSSSSLSLSVSASLSPSLLSCLLERDGGARSEELRSHYDLHGVFQADDHHQGEGQAGAAVDLLPPPRVRDSCQAGDVSGE